MSARSKATLATVVAALALLASASAAVADPGAIVFHATANPEFLGPTANCPIFRLQEPIEAPNGAPMGSFEFCFATFSQDASGGLDATGTATFQLPGGTLLATLHLVEIPTSSNGVVQFSSGAVTGGTGLYSGASGVWHAAGPITFDAEANYPNLHYVIALR
jgi:hypothetical protein